MEAGDGCDGKLVAYLNMPLLLRMLVKVTQGSGKTPGGMVGLHARGCGVEGWPRLRSCVRPARSASRRRCLHIPLAPLAKVSQLVS